MIPPKIEINKIACPSFFLLPFLGVWDYMEYFFLVISRLFLELTDIFSCA